jgi:thiosulfate dehydrogenase [quinone] large subunit
VASERISPLHSLLGHLLHFATPIGVLIALGELAVGLGTLLGLWTRLAALGGMVLSFTLFLTVSYHSSPYYTGADIVFLFAWIPLVVAGSGGALSLDAVVASRARASSGLDPVPTVPVPFSFVQQTCGHYEEGRCSAQRGAPCGVVRCPVLGQKRTDVAGAPLGDLGRRRFVLGAVAAGAVGATGLVAAGLSAGIGRAAGGAPAVASGTTNLPGPTRSSGTTNPGGAGSTSTTSPATTPTTTGPTSTTTPPGTAIGPARDVPVGGAANFTDPSTGDPSLVLQPSSGRFVAFDAVCPHAGCTVGFMRSADLLVCPCHGSQFNPNNGDVEVGPAPHGLRRLTIAEGSDGQLYVEG